MRVSIAYTVPVQVIVDLETGEVESVHVIDESVQEDRNGYTEDADTYATPIPEEQRDAAYKIAKGRWPGWEFGF